MYLQFSLPFRNLLFQSIFSLPRRHDNAIATHGARRRGAHADQPALVAQEEGALAVAEELAAGRAGARVLAHDLPVAARCPGSNVAEEDVGCAAAIVCGDALREGGGAVAGEGAWGAGEGQ